MRFALGFAIMVAMIGVFAIAVGAHVADEASRLFEHVNRKLEKVWK